MSPPPAPTPDEQAAYIRYSIELFEVVGRSQQRAKWTGYTAAGVTFVVVMPRLPGSSLRCPYCAGRVPVIAPPKGFAKVEHMAACPSCRRDLPVV